MSKNPPHVWAVDTLEDLIRMMLPAGFSCRNEAPIRVSDSSMSEPDLAVVRGERIEFQRRHPTAAETILLVDVSDTTLANDRGTKPLAYARAGIPAYWIVNLTNRRVERNTNPSSSGYRLSESIAEDGVIPFEVDGQEQGRIAIAGLFLRG